MDSTPAVYKAKVVASNDPLGRGRLRVQIPQLAGFSSVPWATPGDPTIHTLPSLNSIVMVTFEGGDPAKPVWWGGNGETAVPLQMLDANSFATSAANNATSSSKSYTDYQLVGNTARVRAFSTSAFNTPANSWVNIPWFSSENWPITGRSPYATFVAPGVSGDPINDHMRFNVPINGEYLYSAIFAFAALGVGNEYAARAIWQDESNSYNYIVGQAGPHYVSSALMEPIVSLVFSTDQQPGTSVRLQVRTSVAGQVYQDNVLAYGVATRTRVHTTLLRINP